MSKVIKNRKLTDDLMISECSDGYWLYDYTRGMNLAMKAKTPEDAFVEAITYYQKRLTKVEGEFNKLNQTVNDFIDSVSDDDDS